MAQPKSELEELKKMETRSAERRAERKKTPPPPLPDSTSASEDTIPPPKHTLQDLEAQVETIVKELETVATERPGIALLAAFAAGIVAGHLMARR